MSYITSHNEVVDKLIADFGLDDEFDMPSELVNTLQGTLWANNTEQERNLLADEFHGAWDDFRDEDDSVEIHEECPEWQDCEYIRVELVESALKAAYARVWADTVATL